MSQRHGIKLLMVRLIAHDLGIGFRHTHDFRLLDFAIRQGDRDHAIQYQITHLAGITIAVGYGPAQIREIALLAAVLGGAGIALAAAAPTGKAVVHVEGEAIHQLTTEVHPPHRVAVVV